MGKWLKNLAVISFILAVMIASVISNANAAGYGQGHRFGADMKLMAALGLTTEQNTALTTALSTFGPAVKADMLAVRKSMKQLKKDLAMTPPVGTALVADATALAAAKTQLKADRATLDSALSSVLSSTQLTQLQTALTAQFNSRLARKTDRVLFGYAMYLKNQ